ncbi:MAG: ABC transporter ATP-binding protein/permease [Acidobacteria bacterium]|nr:ABC transporter ATP-binding protein/permease [Acidobacteriota bacterium]
MSDHHEEEQLGKAYDARLTRRLLQYLKPYKWRVAFALLLTLAVTPFELVPPYLFKIGVDSYIVPGARQWIEESAALQGLMWVSVAYLAALLLGFAVQYVQIRVMQHVGQETMCDLRNEVFGRLQRLPMSFYDRTPVGRLVTRVTTDVDALNELFAAGVVTMLNDVVLLVVMVVLLFTINATLALAALSVLPFLLLVTYLFRNTVRDANRRIRTAIARINAFLQEHISGMSVVQLFNHEGRDREQFSVLNRRHMEAYKDAILAFALFYPAVEFLTVTAIALILWFGGSQVLSGGIQVGVLIAFILYAQRFFRPIQDLSEKFNILQTAMASSERIFKLLDEPVTIASPARPQRMETPRGEIEFRNVWFSYKTTGEPAEEDWVLRDISFRVAPGETAALVGHTGAGKTTIISLLLRFYDVQRGQILLDRTDIRQFDLQELRRHFGIVLQDPFLFSGTLDTNVRLGTVGIDRAGVERALREVGLGQFMAGLPQGADTLVSERGATYSVGQRQLVSFARALAHNPRFLVLDEATSSVDTKTELLIRSALDRLLENRTAIVIAHRLSTIQHAHRILVFHKGRLREQGSHQKLLVARGIYFRLYQLQYKDQELPLPQGAIDSGAGATLPADD